MLLTVFKQFSHVHNLITRIQYIINVFLPRINILLYQLHVSFETRLSIVWFLSNISKSRELICRIYNLMNKQNISVIDNLSPQSFLIFSLKHLHKKYLT